MQSPSRNSVWTESALCLLLQVMACAHFSLVYIIKHVSFFPLQIYADRGYLLPYQARVLVAWIMAYAARLHPIQAMSRHMPGPVSLRSPYEFCALVLSFACLLGAVWATQASLRILTRNERFSRWASFLVIYTTLFNLALAYGLSYRLPYDVPSLFFFCLCVYLILSRRLALYYLVFIVATFNRETTCFLTLFFLISEWSFLKARFRSQWPLFLHLLLQAAIWIGIKSYLTHLFRNNPTEPGNNGVMTLHLGQNLHFLVNPGEWPQLFSIFGFLLPFVYLGYRWIRDERIKLAAVTIVPLWCFLMLITGVIIEVRVFNELSAFLVPALALILYHWAQDRGLQWTRSSTAQTTPSSF